MFFFGIGDGLQEPPAIFCHFLRNLIYGDFWVVGNAMDKQIPKRL